MSGKAPSRGKVVEAAYVKSFESKYGTLYQHKIVLEGVDGNADMEGEYASKSQDQDKFVVGDIVDYTFEVFSSGSNTWNKIRPYNPDHPQGGSSGGGNRGGGGGGGSRWKPDPIKDTMILVEHSMKCATDMACNSVIKFEDLQRSVDKLVEMQLDLIEKHTERVKQLQNG